MKRKLFSIILFLALASVSLWNPLSSSVIKVSAGSTSLNKIEFTSGFYMYIKGNKDINSDGDRSLSDAEKNAVTSLDISGVDITNDEYGSNLRGVEFFPNLSEFNCSGLGTTGSLDLRSNTKLTKLNCSNSKISSLSLTNHPLLTELDCSNTPNLKSINISGCPNLKILKCDGAAGVTTIDLSKKAGLLEVSLNGMNLSGTLDFSNCTQLTSVSCNNNNISSVNVSGLKNLKVLNVENNSLTSLDVSGLTSLTTLSCSNNSGLGAIDVSSNTRLMYLACSNTGISELNVKGNKGIVELYCSGNSIENLELSSLRNLAYLSCYGNPLSYLDISESSAEKGLCSGNICLLSSDTEVSSTVNVNFSNGPEKGGITSCISDNVKKAAVDDIGSIGYVNYVHNGEEILLKIMVIGIEAGDVRAPIDCEHIFRDYKHTFPMAESSIRIYGNGVTIKDKDGNKINKKIATLYTDIKASYIYTEKKGKVTAKTGKIIVGLTMTDAVPSLNKNKIVDAEAAGIAKARFKSGMITVTATGKGSGVVYLWVIDTGEEGTIEMCPINVAMAPRKVQVKDKSYDDASGNILKNPKIEAGNKLNIFLYPIGGDKQVTGSCTYTVELDAKSQKYASLELNPEGEYGYTITSTDAAAKRKSKITIKITCDQTKKTFKWYANIIPKEVKPEQENKEEETK